MDEQDLTYIKEIHRSHQWKMAFFGLLFLIIGIVIGAGAGVLILGRKPIPEPGHPDDYIMRVTRRMERELNLSEPQAKQIRQIVDKHLRQLYQIREDSRPLIEQEVVTMNQQVMEVLDQQQKRIWQEKTRQLHNRFQKGQMRRQNRPGQQRPGEPLRRQKRQQAGPDGPLPGAPGRQRMRPEGIHRNDLPDPEAGVPPDFAPRPLPPEKQMEPYPDPNQ